MDVFDLLVLFDAVASLCLAAAGAAIAFWSGYMAVKYRCGGLVVNMETFTCDELFLYIVVSICAEALAVGVWILPI